MLQAITSLPQTRQTWRNKPVRELFAEVVEAHPSATEDMLRQRFREAARKDDDYMDAILDYAFDAAFRAHEMQAARRSVSVQQRAVEATKRAETLQTHAARVEYIKEQIILLNQEMPNGMRARNCTLDYMYRLGGKYRALGKQGSQKLVGAVYDEEAYRKKMRGVA